MWYGAGPRNKGKCREGRRCGPGRRGLLCLIRPSIRGGSCATKGMIGKVVNLYVSRLVMSASIAGGSARRRIKRVSVRRSARRGRLTGDKAGEWEDLVTQ